MINIHENANVAPTAMVMGDARIREGASVLENATISDRAAVLGGTVAGRAQIRHRARVYGGMVTGRACLRGDAKVRGRAWILGYAQLSDNVLVSGDDTRVYGYAVLGNDVHVHSGAQVHGSVYLKAGSIGTNGDVFQDTHVISITGLFPDLVTVYRTQDGSARVQAGCQNFPLAIGSQTMLALAGEHGWTLPHGWQATVAGLVLGTESWKNDVCKSDCCLDDRDAACAACAEGDED